jgi:hypothetical protein
LRRSNIDASAGAVEEVARVITRILSRWPRARILLRADAGFAREALMRWCELNRVDYLFGLASNQRLVAAIATELQQAQQLSQATARPARRFKDLMWSTLDSWSRQRRVVGKAEWSGGEANPLYRHLAEPHRARNPPSLREGLLRARRDGEPHQGVPTRPVCRPYLGQVDAAPTSCVCGLLRWPVY